MKLKNLFPCLLPLLCCSALLTALTADFTEIQEGERSLIGERALPEKEMFAMENARGLRLEELSEEDSAAQTEALTTPPAELFSFQDLIDQNYFSAGDVVSNIKAVKSEMIVSMTSHPGIYHNAVGFSGSRIGLEDGSWWTIYSKDLASTRNWLTSANSLVPDTLVIVPNIDWPINSSYRYYLVNQQTGISVKVNMTLSPIKYGLHSKYIFSTTWLIDNAGFFYVQLLLNDGSVWNMLSSDFPITSLWHIDDTVVIGGNEGRSDYYAPNILINVATNNYGAGSCIKY